MMQRIVAPETLDALDEQDPLAIRSRRDLRRVHSVMGTRSIILKAFKDACETHPRSTPLNVLELGAGDGSLMLGVARALDGERAQVHLTLLDQQDLVKDETLKAYKEAGWSAKVLVADALDWADGKLDQVPVQDHIEKRWDLVIVNLFLHHFEGAALNALLRGIERKADRFIAVEPVRSKFALIGSHLIGLIGAGPVTREDAVLSVHAGFRANEISDAWPGHANLWATAEHSAGLFSHCFVAQRKALSKDRSP